MLGLFLSAIINVMGEIIYKQIPIKDYDEDNLDIHLDIKGRGEYKFLDEIKIEDEDEKIFTYKIFGYTQGQNENKSNFFEDEKVYGDYMVVATDNTNPVDFDKEMGYLFIDHDIDEESDNDSHLDENNEYDYSTGFLINDLEDVNDFSMYELS